MTEKKNLLIIVGGSGSWKSSLQQDIMKRYGYIQPTNFTTREPRSEDEVDDYVFLKRDVYLAKYWNGDFLAPNRYLGNHYWTGKFDADKVCMVVTPNGRESVIQELSNSWEYNITCVFLEITKKLQKERLTARGDSPADIKKRQNDLNYFTPNQGSLVFNWATPTYSIADEIICELTKSKNL